MNQSQQLESSVHARSKRNRRHDGKVGDFVHLCAAKIGQNREPTPTYNAVVLIVIEYLSTERVRRQRNGLCGVARAWSHRTWYRLGSA